MALSLTPGSYSCQSCWNVWQSVGNLFITLNSRTLLRQLRIIQHHYMAQSLTEGVSFEGGGKIKPTLRLGQQPLAVKISSVQNVLKQWTTAKHTRESIFLKHRTENRAHPHHPSTAWQPKSDLQQLLQGHSAHKAQLLHIHPLALNFQNLCCQETLSQQLSICAKFYQLHQGSLNFFEQSADFIICMYLHALFFCILSDVYILEKTPC